MWYKLTALLILFCAVSLAQTTPSYPSVVPTSKDLLVAADNAATILLTSVDATSKSLPVKSVTNFVPYMLISIDKEIMQLCGVGVSSLTVCTDGRGYSGTTPAIHFSGVSIRGNITAAHYNNLASYMLTIMTVLGPNLVNVPRTPEQMGAVAVGGSLADLPPSGITAQQYGDASHSAQVTFDSKGRATSASNVAITPTAIGLGNVTNDAQLKASNLDTDSTMAANSDTKISSQKAVKTALGLKAPLVSPSFTNSLGITGPASNADVVSISSLTSSYNPVIKFSNSLLDIFRIGSAGASGDSWLNSYAGLHFGTGSAVYGTNERLTILATGNIGIGTTSPAGKLVVYTAAGQNYIRSSADLTQEAGYIWNKGTIDKWMLYSPISSNDLRLFDTTDRVTFQAGGNVGIGITSPASPLHISSDSGRDTLSITAPTSGTAVGIRFLPFGSGNSARIGAIQTTNAELVMETAGSERLRITAAGKLGLGITTVPTADLAAINGKLGLGVSGTSAGQMSLYPLNGSNAFFHIDNRGDSTLRVSQGASVGSADILTLTNTGYMGLGSGTPASFPLDIRQANAFSGLIHFNGSSTPGDYGGYLWSYDTSMATLGAGSTYYSAGQVTAKATSASDIYQYSGAIQFRSDTGLTVGANFIPTARMNIAAGGNVGIGTTVPQQRFTVGSNSSMAVEMAPPTSPSAALAAGGILTVGTPYFFKITASDGVGETIASAEVTATPTSGNQTINVSWTAVTGATLYKVYRSTTSGTYTTPAFVASVTSSPLADAGITPSAGTIPTSTTAYATRLTSTGNSYLLGGGLGIGTALPSGQLSLNISGAGVALKTWSSNAKATLDAYTVSGAPYTRILDVSVIGQSDGSSGGGAIRFLTNPVTSDTAVERMRIDPAGNVGIGTAAPGAKLVVNNGIAQVNNTIGDTAYLNGWGVDIYPSTTTQYAMVKSHSYPLYFSASTFSSVSIDTAGRVGVGLGNVTLASTLSVYDTTATTGSTTLIVRKGAGQSTNNLMTFQDNSGALMSGVDSNGYWTGSMVTAAFGAAAWIGGSAVASNMGYLFSSTTSSLGTTDVGLSRTAVGVVSVGNGTVGNASGTLAAANVTVGGVVQSCASSTITSADAIFQAASTTATKTLKTLAASERVTSLTFTPTVAYAGTGVTVASMAAGSATAGNTAIYAPALDVTQILTTYSDGGMFRDDSSTALNLIFTANVNFGNGTTTVLTGGTVKVTYCTAIIP